jgi:AcrR family transcriptional regulator
MDAVVTRYNQKNSKITKKASYHHGDLKRQILLSVGKLIEKHRSTEFQLKDIAEMVNTSVPAIYRHFESRQQLLVETAIVGYEVQKSFRDFGLSKNNATSLHKLLVIGFAYVVFAREYPGLFILMKNLETNQILASQEYIRLREETLQLIKSIFRNCIDEGLIVESDSEIALTFLQATSLGFAQMVIRNSMQFYAPIRGHDQSLLVNIYEMALQGLLTPYGKSVLKSATIDPFAGRDVTDFP